MRYIFGTWSDGAPLTPDDVAELLRTAEERREEMARYPTDKVLRLMERLKALWCDEKYKPRVDLERILPELTGFSPEMVKKGFLELSILFDGDLFERKLRTELRGITKGAFWRYDSEHSTAYAWHPLGTVLHILSGNVFVVAAGSLVAGLITGNVNIFKMSSEERLFLPALVKSIVECDTDGVVSRSIAVLDFSSRDQAVLDTLKKSVDGIVVWGGEEAVKALRNDLPARTRLIVFGPRLSLSVVTKNGMKERGVKELSKSFADEISIWDQNACTAPQLIYVEGHEEAAELTGALAEALKEKAKELPCGDIDFESAVEIRKLRTVFELAEARGKGLLRESPENLDWTVILDHDPTIETSPLHRTIKVIPYNDISLILPSMEALRGYLQTAGLAASLKERTAVEDKLARAGFLRIVDVGQMESGEIDDPHDGGYDIPQFVNIVFSRSRSFDEDYEPVDFAEPGERLGLINERLRRLIDYARRSEFYRERLQGITVDTVADLPKIPTLARDEMERHMPPCGHSMGTGPFPGGYVSRSGGSTGEPTFSIYDGHDWDRMIGNAVRIFRGTGLRRGDRLANCFIAGNMYGSFVSFDHIACRLGVTSFAFGSEVKDEAFLDTWKKFSLNAIMGIPTTIVPMLRRVRKNDPSFTIEKIVFAGSPMSESDYIWLKEELGASSISSIIGANDGGQIGWQCQSMKGAMHHTADDFNYIEIVDEQGAPLPDGEAGRIVITSLLKHNFPLIRYEIGDEGRIVPGECLCGRTCRRIEHLGRADDVIVLGLINIRHRDIAASLADHPVTAVQLAAQNRDEGEFLLLRVESDRRDRDFAELVRQTVTDRIEMIRYRLETGAIVAMDVELHEPGALPRHPVSGKLKRIIDERV